MMQEIAACMLTLISMLALPGDAQERLIGQKASAWEVEHWLNSDPLDIAELKGHVVLVRWWTGPGCPYCSNSAAALNEFHETYERDGLRVVGFYHHKSPQPLSKEDVAVLADQLGFAFPIAVDPQWQTLKAWWLDTGDRNFTSVSFLLDREGVIRHIHPGGQYVKGDNDYEQLKSAIERLLKK